MTDPSAEYRFYAKAPKPDDERAPCEPVDLDEWGRLLDTDTQFAVGGRYGIVPEHFEGRERVQRLLEIGCGSGIYVAHMQKFAIQCYGADIYLEGHLRQMRPSPLKFLEFNANHEFPIEDSFFDVVVAMMVMEHVFDPFHFCRELHRILRPSGTLFINIPLVTAIGHRLTLLTGRLPVTSHKDWFDKRAWDGAHLHYFTLPLLRKLLGVYGFEIDLLRGVGRFHTWKTRFPTLLAKEISVRARKVT
jgi:SAM-dependent methyltransferase